MLQPHSWLSCRVYCIWAPKRLVMIQYIHVYVHYTIYSYIGAHMLAYGVIFHGEAPIVSSELITARIGAFPLFRFTRLIFLGAFSRVYA